MLFLKKVFITAIGLETAGDFHSPGMLVQFSIERAVQHGSLDGQVREQITVIDPVRKGKDAPYWIVEVASE